MACVVVAEAHCPVREAGGRAIRGWVAHLITRVKIAAVAGSQTEGACELFDRSLVALLREVDKTVHRSHAGGTQLELRQC